MSFAFSFEEDDVKVYTMKSPKIHDSMNRLVSQYSIYILSCKNTFAKARPSLKRRRSVRNRIRSVQIETRGSVAIPNKEHVRKGRGNMIATTLEDQQVLSTPFNRRLPKRIVFTDVIGKVYQQLAIRQHYPFHS